MILDKWIHRKKEVDEFAEPVLPVSLPSTVPARNTAEQLEQELDQVRHHMHLLSKEAQQEDVDTASQQQAQEFFNQPTQKELPDREAQLRRAIYELERHRENLNGKDDKNLE